MAAPTNVAKKAAPAGTARPTVKVAPKLPDLTPRERREQGVAGILQFIAAPLLLVPRLRPDACVVAYYGEAVGKEVADIADNDPRLARLVDKVASLGPYAGLATLVMAMGFQMAANHGLVQPGIMGSLPPEKFVALVLEEEVNSDDESASAGR